MRHEGQVIDLIEPSLKIPLSRRKLGGIVLGGIAAAAMGTLSGPQIAEADNNTPENTIETTGTPPESRPTSYLGKEILVSWPRTWNYSETRDYDGNKIIRLTKDDTSTIGEISLLGREGFPKAIADQKIDIKSSWGTQDEPAEYGDPEDQLYTKDNRKGFVNQYDMHAVFGFSLAKIKKDVLFDIRYLNQYPDTDGDHIAMLKLTQSRSLMFSNNQALYGKCARDRNDFYVLTVGNFQAL